MSENTYQAADAVRAEGEQVRDESTPVSEETKERDEKGQYAFGNKGGPGNPFARNVAWLRGKMYRELKEGDIEGITRAMIDKAKTGHVPAAKLVLSYLLGQPQKGLDPDHLDLHEWEIQKGTAPMFVESGEISKAPAAELALEITRSVRPVMAEIQRREFLKVVNGETPVALAKKRAAEKKERRRQKRAEKGRQQTGFSGSDVGASRLANGGFDDARNLRVGPVV